MGRRFGLSAAELKDLRKVMIDRSVQLQLTEALDTTGNELCAALYGHLEDGTVAVDRRRWLLNREACSSSFAASVTELLAQPLKFARLLGVFHSHPCGAALPSDLDCAGIARLPFVWVIAGFDDGDPELRAFAWSDSGVREIRCSQTTQDRMARRREAYSLGQ